MSVLEQLFQRETTEQVQYAGAEVSIIYATALADSSNGSVLLQIGDAIGADEAVGYDDEASSEMVDMDDAGDDSTVETIDEDSDAEVLTPEEIVDGMDDPADVDETDADDESDEDVSDEVVDEIEDDD